MSEDEIAAKITPEMLKKLDEIAKREGLSRNKALEAAVAKAAGRAGT